MRICLLAVGAAVLMISCGAPVSQPRRTASLPTDTGVSETAAERYGLTIVVPIGWEGAISRGWVRFANRALPGLALCGGHRELRPEDIVVEVREVDPPPDERSYFRLLGGAPRLRVGDFRIPEPGTYAESHGAARVPFSLAGRFFVLFAESSSRPVDAATVEDANRALATLAVMPGDFYPGEVEPGSFAPAPGLESDSSGPRPVGPDGDWTVSWAATIPYRDE